MAWQRRRLVRLDMLCLGANPDRIGRQDIPAIAARVLSDEQQQELHRLNYKQKAGTLAPAEAVLRARLEQISRRGK
jgi:hypothetical protein